MVVDRGRAMAGGRAHGCYTGYIAGAVVAHTESERTAAEGRTAKYSTSEAIAIAIAIAIMAPSGQQASWY